jgi:hypothetical protein
MKELENKLRCTAIGCYGRFAYMGDDPQDSALYRCGECGKELDQDGMEHIAEKHDGPVGELAEKLLEGYGE